MLGLLFRYNQNWTNCLFAILIQILSDQCGLYPEKFGIL